MMSIKGKNEDIYSPAIKEGEDDMCSLLESSGGSEEYELFPALRVREMSFSEGENIEEHARREQGCILSMGHCKAGEGTDQRCFVDSEETKAEETCKKGSKGEGREQEVIWYHGSIQDKEDNKILELTEQDNFLDINNAEGGKPKEQNSEVECEEGMVVGHMNEARRDSVSDVPLDPNSLNGFLLATGAWELEEEVDHNWNLKRQLLDMESSDDEEVMREKAAYSQYLDSERSSVKDQELRWFRKRTFVEN